MAAGYIDGAREVRALLEVFKAEIADELIRPLVGKNNTFVLGLDAEASFYVEMSRDTVGGTVWVTLVHTERGPVDEWTDAEIGGSIVGDLWTECRNRLYSTEFEEGVAAVTEWLRRHQHRRREEKGGRDA